MTRLQESVPPTPYLGVDRSMTRLTLSAADRRELLDLVRRSPEPEVRVRSHILVLLADGHPWVTIAAVLFCSASTFARWKDRFEAGGADAVFGRPRGRKRCGVHIWAGLVVRWVLALSPTTFRFARSRWSCEAAVVVLRDAGLVWRRLRPIVHPPGDRQRKATTRKPEITGE